MKMSTRFRTIACALVPALASAALATPAFAHPATAAAPAPVLVMRYSFNLGAPAGRVADTSGHGQPLTLRSSAQGTVRFVGTATSKYAGFPPVCATTTTATTCPKALLEAPNVTALNPGTRRFTWGATVRVTKAQLGGSANVMQKGVVTTESQWKLQLGATAGRAQCVVVGRGTAKPYLVRSTVGVADGAWHRIQCRRAGSSLTVSVDGQSRGTMTIPAIVSIGNTLPMRIGGPNFSTGGDMFHGDLDDAYAILG
jgi:hypothetical protein